MHRKMLLGFLGLSLAAAAATYTPTASACGGMFCNGNSGPVQQTIDQRGENILFVMENGKVEAHIQIQYVGDATKFGWVLPLQAVPELAVGSEALFKTLLSASDPVYGYTTSFSCSPGGGGFGGGFGSSGAAGSGTAGSGGGGGGPTIVLQQTVGAFDVTVLQGGQVDEVVKWLDDNGFLQSPEAPPILEKYLAKGYLFAAVKMTGRAGVDEIHPLVVRYPGTSPCVPLELTKVAATEDMVVRTFFLGDRRVIPKNYRHVELSDLGLDWLNATSGYYPLLAKAVDAPVADGRAFVTEMAGNHGLAGIKFSGPAWQPAKLDVPEARAAMQELVTQGLLQCGGCSDESCRYKHGLLEGILAGNLVVPKGIPMGQYLCAAINEPLLPLTYTATSKTFADQVDERIVKPAKRAEDLLAQHGYLTRMTTMISPVEMTEDPDFVVGDVSLPMVPRAHYGTRNLGCNGLATSFVTNDGVAAHLVCLDGGQWPFELASAPAARKVQLATADGKLMTLVDKSTAIDAALADSNTAHCPAGTAGSGGGPGTGGSGVAGKGGSGVAGKGGAGKGGTGQGGTGSGSAGKAGGVAGNNASGQGGGGGIVGDAGAGGADESKDEGPADPGCTVAAPSGAGGLAILGAATVLRLLRRRRR